LAILLVAGALWRWRENDLAGSVIAVEYDVSMKIHELWDP
jgi:hypothetical protein